jgi:hypothetical protein
MPTDPAQPRVYQRPQLCNVFDWLDQVRQRPGMYLGDSGLRGLETLIWGYYSALGVHHLDEGVPQMTRHFSSWLRFRKRWSLSQGWARAIEEHAKERELPLENFFQLVEEYRKLRPKVLCQAVLRPQHSPTGKRSVIGLDDRVEPPVKIDVVQYHPEPLHFLRFHYPEGPENQDILMTASGKVTTMVEDARRWAEDEFQLSAADWASVL